MSRKGYALAVKIGKNRKQFPDQESAEAFFTQLRTESWDLLAILKEAYPDALLDFSPESLKDLEGIYFDLYDRGLFSTYAISKQEFEILLAIYSGQVFVEQGKATWVVVEDPYVGDKRYFLAIRSLDGFYTIDCTSWRDHETRPNNKRRQLIYREYVKYAEGL